MIAGLYRSISAKAGFHARLLMRFYVTRLFIVRKNQKKENSQNEKRKNQRVRSHRSEESFGLVDTRIKVEREIHGTIYTVTGSFEGNELLENKLTRILLKNVEDAK